MLENKAAPGRLLSPPPSASSFVDTHADVNHLPLTHLSGSHRCATTGCLQAESVTRDTPDTMAEEKVVVQLGLQLHEQSPSWAALNPYLPAQCRAQSRRCDGAGGQGGLGEVWGSHTFRRQSSFPCLHAPRALCPSEESTD